MSSQSVGLGFTSGDLALRMLSLRGFGICFWVVSDTCLETAAACCNPLVIYVRRQLPDVITSDTALVTVE